MLAPQIFVFTQVTHIKDVALHAGVVAVDVSEGVLAVVGEAVIMEEVIFMAEAVTSEAGMEITMTVFISLVTSSTK